MLLVLFYKIGCLYILERLFGQVLTTPEIAKEVRWKLPEWVIIQAVENKDLLDTYIKLVDKGEASAIALAHEVVSPSLILDDNKARRLALSLKLPLRGTVGTLVLAKQKGIIPLLKPYFEKIKTTNFHISARILQTVLDEYES